MGTSHARAYVKMKDFEIIGLVSRGSASREKLSKELGGLPQFDNIDTALKETKPDAVSINTYPDTHAAYVKKALEANCHVFVEKPLAQTVKESKQIAALAAKKKKKLVIGYILRHHPSWMKFVELAHTLGKPLVMRMNLNQQSSGEMWVTHKQLMNALPPIVDCGVHYVDMMCLMTRSKPVRVQAIGARLSQEIKKDMYNYGQLQVVFEDGSVGWYEAGWGPMMSETAYFIKDVIGPKGCVSIAGGEKKTSSSDIDSHTKTNQLKLHSAELWKNGKFLKKDKLINMSDEPGHQELCDREQAFFLKAIKRDFDLTDHINDAINSLKIVLAADESLRKGRTINL